MVTGKIFAIKRFEIHDGDGIRTTLFLKGCPLRCKWCHNPEGLTMTPQLSYRPGKCIGCGECVRVCQAHSMMEKGHIYDRSKCIGCGKCAEECLGGALQFYGQEVTPADILPKLLDDRAFFAESGGGVTISGGEPMLQADFAAELLRLLKENGIHTALDTCGAVEWSAYEKVLPWVDLILYDVKAADENVHIACTGRSNRLILDNLRRLDEVGKTIDVRIPYIPGMNDDQIEKIGNILTTLRSLRAVKVLPYHNYSGSQYDSLGMVYPIPEVPTPEIADIDKAVWTLRSMGIPATDQTGDPPKEE